MALDLFKLTATLGMDASEFEKGITKSKKSISEFRSDVMKLAHEYKKQGKTMQEAMKLAHQNINRDLYDFGEKTEKTTEKAKRHWKLFGKAVEDTNKTAFDKATQYAMTKAAAIGNIIADMTKAFAKASFDLGKSAVTAAAEVVAEQAQFKATFGELQGEAEKAFNNISKSTGVFGTRLKNVGTKAFSQFKGAGMDGVDALGAMEKYTNIAADAAAYYDITLEEADEKLRSFLRGNTEAGDAIGLFTSESQRNTYAMDAYGKKWAQLTEEQKQMLMLNVAEDIYEQSGAIGQASREADSWTNVIGNLKEGWRQMLGVVGRPIMETLTPVIQKITVFLTDAEIQKKFEQFSLGIADIANATFDKIETFFKYMVDNGTPLTEGFGKLATAFTEIGKLVFDDVISFLTTLIGGPDGMDDTIKNIGTFFTDVSTFMTNHASSITTLIELIMAFWAVQNPFMLLIMALGVIITNWEDVKALVVMAKNWFDKFIQTHVPEGFLSGAITAWETITGIIQSAIDLTAEFLESLTGASIADGSAQVAAGMQSGGIIGGIKAAYNNSWYKGLFDGWFGGEDNKSNVDYESYGGGYGAKGWATGIDYVPYNDMPARLHEGEAVLTKAEATAWRNGGDAQIDYNAMGAAVGQGVREALQGIGLYTDDGTRIADLVTERVSRNIAQGAKRWRFNPA